MGLESEPVRIRVSGGPIRCPYCHADVLREEETWVACDACLARHHTACWSEGNGCAGCGETRFLSREQALTGQGATVPALAAPSVGEGDLPSIDLELRGEPARFEGHERLELVARPGRSAEAAELVVANRTARAHRVDIHRLPPWARVEGPAEHDLAPGETARFRITILVDDAPFEHVALRTERGALNGTKDPIPDAVRSTFVVATGDDSLAVSLEVERALPDRALFPFALWLGIAFPPGILFALIYASRGRRPVRAGGESIAHHLLLVRRAEANARLARLVASVLCFTLPLFALIGFIIFLVTTD